ncbi:hypothetical protein PG996_012480 [Apiospora saccharicola]|uniref:OTU domain-containing protein n=1 Tax=Apiospora saccharicola TaxID=335842 RepID=A0ABR1U5H7_9PEZI
MEEKESLETVQARHRKEQRDLQSRITSKKKNATKKTRKGVNDECTQLEHQMKERQQQEIAALSGESNDAVDDAVPEEQNEDNDDVNTTNNTNGLAEQLQQTSISVPTAESQQQQQQQQQPGKKRNRQKERLQRRAAEQEAAALAAEEEAANMTDHRKIEKTYMLKEFKTHGLAEKEIQPDGHCLFSAVADQLRENSVPLEGAAAELPYRTVRRRATDYMRAHEDDFAPFMEDDFGSYVAKIRDTAEWGGQLELMALARSYGVEIKVVQEQRTETIDPGEVSGDGEGERKTIWLAYYRHGYGLGEHYNSLRKAA